MTFAEAMLLRDKVLLGRRTCDAEGCNKQCWRSYVMPAVAALAEIVRRLPEDPTLAFSVEREVQTWCRDEAARLLLAVEQRP